MNRIILIGNGFDLAHGLKTSYRDFIDNFWTQKAKQIGMNGYFCDKDNDIDFLPEIKNILSNHGAELSKCNNYKSLCKFIEAYGQCFKITNNLLETITTKCGLQNWVDIEKEFYNALKKCLSDKLKAQGEFIQSDGTDSIENLNKDFERIKRLLGDYLSTIQISSDLFNLDIFNKIVCEFKYQDFTQTYKKQYIQDKIKYISSIVDSEDDPLKESDENIKREFKNRERINQRGIERILNASDSTYFFSDLLLQNILFVNFNYTSTPEIYKKDIYGYNRDLHKLHHNQPFIDTEEIYMHGKLKDSKNPIIFGFGDEIDEDYSKIENLDDNRFLENIKSTRYHETDNYKKLLEYIDSDYFQIFIFGHSCGLSDRTLLSTLFNHQNCVSIKPFYYIKEDGTDNYSDLVRNISRHFTDKALLRDKVVNKTYCGPLIGSK